MGYLRLFEELHAVLPFDLHVWIDPSLEGALEYILSSPGAGRRTIGVKAFEDLDFYSSLGAIASLPRPDNGNDVTDVPAFSMVSYCKPSLVAEAASSSKATEFAWIDFGIAHVADLLARWEDFRIGALVRVCEISATARSEVADRRAYYRDNRYRIAAGLMTGGREAFAWLTERMRDEVSLMIASGRRVHEEPILSVIAAEHPDRFEVPWFSDYIGILRNYVGVDRHGDLPAILGNLTRARELSLHKRGTEIANAIISSAASRRLHLEPSEAARLLHDAFICAFYADVDLAKHIADVITGLYAHGCATARSALERMRPLLDTNLRCVGATLEAPISWEYMASLEDFSAWRGSL